MKKLSLYPFLFGFYVILVPLAQNLDQLDPALALRPLTVVGLAATGGLVLFYILLKDWHYAGYLVFLVTLYFFGFGPLNRAIQQRLFTYGSALDERFLLVVCTVWLGILALKKVWTRLGGRTWLIPYLNLLVAFWLLFPTYRLLTGFVFPSRQAGDISYNTQASPGGMTLDCSDTPDIYYIILDGYGRGDVLDSLYPLDTRPFLDYLRRNGFYVATESYTNYIQTIFALPASLNFNYIDPPGKGVNGRSYFSERLNDNEIMAALKLCGYQTVAIESGYFFSDHPEVDVYLEHNAGPNEFESLLLADSPADVLGTISDTEISEYSLEAHRRRVEYGFEKLGELYQMPGPKFVFAYIISPHPPFIFDESGQFVEPESGYTLADGDDYQGNLDEYKSGYAAQVQFVNRKLEQVIDSLLANSPTPPVIILQGDHGPGSHLDWDSPFKTCLWERTPILNAYFLPGEGSRRLYPSISPVNSFRVVLNAYFKTNLPLLPDNTYFTSHRLEGKVIDITTQRASHANCNLP